MIRQVISGQKARLKLKTGANKIAQAIVSTMGPKGKTVIFEDSIGQPISTKDGVTVAKQFQLEDKYENMGAEMIKQVSMKMNDDVGDGTTTVSCLANFLINECYRNVMAGSDPVNIRQDLERGAKKIVAKLEEMSKDVETKEDIFKVAKISANDDEIGQVIADIVDQTGKEGIVTVEESHVMELSSELIDGFEIKEGYMNPYMMTDYTRNEAIYEDVALLISERKIETVSNIVPIIEKIAQGGSKQLVILTTDINDDVIGGLVMNKLKGNFNTLVIKAPMFGTKRKELLEDIAILTGATLINDENGIKFDEIEIEHLGRVGKVIAKDTKTAFINGKGNQEEIIKRVEQLKTQLDESKDDFIKEKLKARIAYLQSKVGVIKVGGTTEMELKEKKYRVDDALCATRAANEEGILPGGGIALFRALESLNDEESTEGIKILRKALIEPIMTISRNAGHDVGVILANIVNKPQNYGFNAATGVYENDMLEAGIIDPTKVVKQALENAVSIAIQFISTETVITNKPEENK